MPAQVQVGTTAQYGEKELGAFTAQAVEAVKGISEGNIEKIKNSITNTGESATMMAESAVTKTLDIIPGFGWYWCIHGYQKRFCQKQSS